MVKKSLLAMLTAMAAFTASAALSSPNGIPYREIVVAADAADSVRLAGSELRKFAAQLCGAELEIVTVPTGAPAIYLGSSPALAKIFTLPVFPSEGYMIRTVDDNLAIAGEDYAGPVLAGTENPFRKLETYNPELKLSVYGAAGTLTGVYEFLYRFGGVRFYWPGDTGTVLDPVKDLRLSAIDVTGAPRASSRYPWFALFELNPESALWARRVGIGSKAPLIIMHNYGEFLKYKDSHPEYFALVDGKRAFGYECVGDGLGHLCLTNPAVIQQWADDICAWFDRNPEVEIYPLVPNDGLTRICECPTCAAEVRPELGSAGKFSYHIWNFTAKVAALVAQRHPDKYIGGLAYSTFAVPPPEIETLPHVVVMICNARGAMANPQNADELHRRIETWSRKCDRIYLWSWYLDHWMPWRGLPVMYADTIERELNYMFANPKYDGEFIEAEAEQALGDQSKLSFPAMQHWALYLTARMYWDRDHTARELFEEYCDKFYGPAAEPMREFWRAAEERRNERMTAKTALSPDELFPVEFIKQLEALLDQAVAATAPESIYRTRIDAVKREFEVGAGRLIRVQSVGVQHMEVPLIESFADFDAKAPLLFCGRDGEQREPATWLFAGYDRKYLYFEFLCYEPEMNQLKATDPGNREDIWMDDCVEIFLYPDESDRKAPCYQLIVNSTGLVYDCRNLALNVTDPAWESNAEVEVKKEENRWIVSVKIPFASIGISDPFFTGDLAGNFYRSRTLGGPRIVSCWTPTGDMYNFSPDKFGIITLKKQ